MAQPWFEGLSEEWVPQPTPTATPNMNSSSNPQVTQSVPPKLQSRIPRLRHSSGSFSEIHIREVPKNLRLPKPRSALAERSLSDNNIPPTATPDAQTTTRSRSASDSFAESSQGSVVYSGTVAQKVTPKSPDKQRQIQDTPEWRRRLLRGEAGYGEQKDLFSPMGLENIFQKPSGGSTEDSKPRKSRLGLSSALPSSPPPWPIEGREESEGNGQDRQKQPEAKEGGHDEAVDSENSVYFSSINELEVPANPEPPRTVSGQLEFENENFSPVGLSNLQIELSPSKVPSFDASSLAQRLQHLGTPQPTPKQRLPLEGNSVAPDRSQNDSSLAKLQDDTLPEDLPAGTPDIGDQLSPFVEMKRGGYSQDSFRRRPLSPSPGPKFMARPSNSNRAGSKLKLNTTAPMESQPAIDDTTNELDNGHNAGSPSLRPVTPHRSGKSLFLSPERAHPSGSPLKLFDAHDTFTSNRLQRRLSQLEHKPEKMSSTSNGMESSRQVQKSSRMASLEETSIQNALESSPRASPAPSAWNGSRRVSTFGQGQLDEYTFPEELSVLSQDSLLEDSCPESSPPTDVAPPGSRPPIRFHLDASPNSLRASRARRQGLTRVSSAFRKVTYSQTHSIRRPSETEPDPDFNPEPEYAEGKRGPTSPFKNPKRKRRRTLLSMPDEQSQVFNDSEVGPVADSHTVMQAAIMPNRQESHSFRYSSMADPDTLARRQLLRPRNPTPSQRRRDGLQAEILEATEAFMISSPRVDDLREQLASPDSPGALSERQQAALIANEIAAFTMNRPPVARHERRKRSVTTQDFLDEAVKIMDYIRAKGRPNSGLESLEETETESPQKENNEPPPSSPLTFSRPPSREGRVSEWREPNKHELDPNTMSHLRKYQEDESDDFMGSSVRSWRIPQRHQSNPHRSNGVVAEQDDIRITDRLDRETKELFHAEAHSDGRPRTNDTHQSASSSLGHTVGTNVSRRSEHVATLAPEAVAHLIPEQIAGMSFDREKNIWVRNKSPSKEHHPAEETNNVTESEEDPFGEIPDLTVDETAENMMQNQAPINKPQPTAETFLEDTEENPQAQRDPSRPVTREGKETAATDSSSVPSKFSNNFTWSFPKTETRATSWSDQTARNGTHQKMQHAPTTTYPIPESDEVDVEHEIKYYEGRAGSTPYPNRTLRDITFSIGQRRDTDTPGSRHPQQWPYDNARQTSQGLGGTWRPTPGARTLPSSRRHTQTEDMDASALEGLPPRNYRMQLSMNLSAPHNALMTLPSSPAKADMTFMLSDLPDFTLNQVDECEIQDRVVVKHDGTRFSKSLEDRYAQGTADLIKALQDVAPDEPYWEDLRKLDLHDKGLANLHRLDEFCYRLEELDVRNNNISQLKGVPHTMRRLTVVNNSLTGLTSWASLMNLQRLDISNNDIDCLDGLSELVHLRTLQVDNNRINSLEGVLLLDGLIELSACGNQIETVDFAKADMKSLTDLNLSSNRIVEVRNLHCLPQLRNFDLDDNCIDEFPSTDMPMAKCKSLRSLRLSRNGMTTLDVASYCPTLESLHVDGNSLAHLPDIEHLAHLRTFSAREQVLPSPGAAEDCVRNLFKNPDVHNLYISVNPIQCLPISQHLLNLQRLELSSMSLEELPADFGQLTPNIRHVNLNFNSLKDLRPLLNIKRLDTLLVAGNKLNRLRTNLAVLGKLSTLTKLDLRDNPLTLRFYPPVSETRVMSLRRNSHSEESQADRFVLPDGDPEEDRRYLQRLDFETRLRRRVQEIMLSMQCAELKVLDGLPFERERVLVKDDVWERLTRLGVIRRAETSTQYDE